MELSNLGEISLQKRRRENVGFSEMNNVLYKKVVKEKERVIRAERTGQEW